MVVAAIFGLLFVGLYHPQASSASMQDISNVKILVTAPYAALTRNGFFLDTNPYRMVIYITLKINNPSPNKVVLQVEGKANVTLSGQISGNYVLDTSRNIVVEGPGVGYYEIHLYTGNAGYSNARAVNVTFNDAQVTELWRGAGTPPPLPTPTPSILP